MAAGRASARWWSTALSFPGIVEPFSTEVLFGERVGVLGRNGTGKSHFLAHLAGQSVAHDGDGVLGARVVPGHFCQTHDRPDLDGRAAPSRSSWMPV